MRDTKDQDFKPTPAMKLYAFHKAKGGKTAKDSKISEFVGVTPETISRWKKIKGFVEWLEEAEALHKFPIDALLEQKAVEMIQAGDFRYWEAMAKKSSYLSKDDGGVRVIRLAYNLEDLEDDEDTKDKDSP